jgi:hypothetical protein
VRRLRNGHRGSRGAAVAAARQHWLLVRGTGERPLDRYVDPERLRAHSSTRRPAIQLGDLAVCYAAVWQALFAVVEVVGHPDHDPVRSRWAWRIPLRALSWIDDLDLAPPVRAAGVSPASLGRHSYVRLTPEQFSTAAELVQQSS